MVNGSPIYFYKTKSLSNLRPSSLIAVKVDGEDFFSLYVTDKTGIPYPIKDETGGGGGGTITAIQNTDGNLEITGTTTKTINVSPSLLSLINSALQPGDNVSELSNDAGYITLADIPTFNPTDYDLDDFNNASADPFVRTSDLGGAVDSVNGQTGVVVLDAGDVGAIPLSGTTSGNPVTGDIEINDTKKIFTETESGYFDIITDIDNNLETTINVRNSDNTTRSSLLLSGSGDSSLQSISTYNSSLVSGQDGVKLFSNNPNYKGIEGENDYSEIDPSNLNIYTQRQYVENGLALKANLQNVEQFIISKSNGTFGSHTGDLLETVIQVIDINANEFVAGDWMTLLFSGEKDASAGNITWRIRAGVNGNTSDAQIALLNASSANSRYVALYRGRPQFLTGNQLRIWGGTSSASTDISNSGAPSLVSLNPTSAWKLTVTAQLTVATETASLTGYRIGKIKSF